MKLIILLSFIFLINYSYSTSSNIYSFTSDSDYSLGQYFFIIDATNNQIIQNITLNLPCSISGILSANDTNVLLLCEGSAGVVEEFYLTSIDITTGEYKNLKSIQSSISYLNAIGEIPYYNNAVHIPGVLGSRAKNVSILNLNFNSNTLNFNTFNSLNYKYVNGAPIGGFDYNNEIYYILYPSENKTSISTTFPTNIIAFHVNNIKDTQKFFNNVENIRNEYTELLFCGPQGQLYAVNGNPGTSSFDICQVNLVELTCNNVLSVPVQNPSESFSFLDWYLSGSKQQVIFTSIVSNYTQVQFDIYEISDFSHTQYIVDNIWNDYSSQYTYTYFYLQ